MSGPLPDRIRLPLSFDPTRLKRDLAAVATAPWVEHFVKQNYDGEWAVLPLRGPAGETHPIRMSYSDPGCTAFEDTPFLARCPYVSDMLSRFDCPLQSVRLMRLAPGSRIKEHSDLDLDYEAGQVRLHVPVATSDDVDFRLNGTPVRLREGETWYLRLSDPHSVVNRGREARVHLVIDAVVDAWLDALLREAG